MLASLLLATGARVQKAQLASPGYNSTREEIGKPVEMRMQDIADFVIWPVLLVLQCFYMYIKYLHKRLFG